MEDTHPFCAFEAAEAGYLGVGICRSYFNTHPLVNFIWIQPVFECVELVWLSWCECGSYGKDGLFGGGFQEVFYGATKGGCKLVEGLALGLVYVGSFSW